MHSPFSFTFFYLILPNLTSTVISLVLWWSSNRCSFKPYVQLFLCRFISIYRAEKENEATTKNKGEGRVEGRGSEWTM